MTTRPYRLCRAFSLTVIAFALAVGLFACAQPQQGPPLPPVSLGLAGFTQPMDTGDLLAGFLPEDTPHVDPKALPHLDDIFANVLRAKTERSVTGVAAYHRCRNARPETQSSQNSRGTALARWVAVGRCMNVDYLLVPHIVEFRERDGGEMGVTRPAKVLMDIFLVDTVNTRLISRSHYDETQAALSANLLDTGKFISRGGKWVTASALAQEGMEKAVKELGL